MSAKTELKPLNWQQGNVAISPTYFYLIYNHLDHSITVNCTHRATYKTDAQDGFDTIEAAQAWVLNNHHAKQLKLSEQIYNTTGLTSGQRWANRFQKGVITEVKAVQKNRVYVNSFIESDVTNKSGIIPRHIDEIIELFRSDYQLMREGGTVDQTLARMTSKVF